MDIAVSRFRDAVQALQSLLTPEITEYLLLVLTGLAVLLFCLWAYQRRRLKQVNRQLLLLNYFFTGIRPSDGLETAASRLLEAAALLVKADAYYFYLREGKNGQYILKAVRHCETGAVEPDFGYSGVSVARETYLSPLSLVPQNLPSGPALSKDGQVPFLDLPAAGGEAMVRVGPLKRMPVGSRKALRSYCELLTPVITALQEMENLKNEVAVQAISSKAVQNFTHSAMDLKDTLSLVVALSINMIGAAGGCFLIREKDRFAVPVVNGLDNAEAAFRADHKVHNLFARLLGDSEFFALTRDQEEMYQLPPYLAAAGGELLILASVPAKKGQGIAAFWYDQAPSLELHRFTGLQLMMKRLGDLLDIRQGLSQMAGSYTEILKILVQTIDNLEPNTAGYSELMARYAGIIAREMGLDRGQIRDITLAAYLSNIGVLGFSNELLHKPGSYSEVEYEAMKHHAAVEASIIEATIANQNVARYIRYHHERLDGNGYPEGLRGEEIPLGSRIIAVAQTFLAKVNSRKYRESLPYAQAIQLLQSAAGTQLDPEAVRALIGWFRKKQANPALRGRSLGSCWEMRCAPSGICRNCPAYGQLDRNCWEISGTLCEGHGNKCSTCLVYTEYAWRMSPEGRL